MRSCIRRAALIGVATLLSLPASANVITGVVNADTTPCDTLAVPSSVDELGLVPPFPAAEAITTSVLTTTTTSACTTLTTDNALVANTRITITNATGLSFTSVWYVADSTTTITNQDGTVNGLLAFKIDTVGANRPLISESGTSDGIFAPGETWTFILQDYSNTLSLSAGAIATLGVSLTSGGTTSSGNIIVIPVPEPASAALVGLGLGLLALGTARRRAARHIAR